MPKKTKIDIAGLSADAQAAILKQLQEAASAQEEADAEEYKVEVEAYYTLKAELEKQLEKALTGALGKAHFSIAKKLKVIASLPPKKPTTAVGYIKAHNAIATGKVGARKRAPKPIAKVKETAKPQKKQKAPIKKGTAAQIKRGTAPIKKT
jgi:hypothetical protein